MDSGLHIVNIDGVTFELSLLGAKTGRRVLTRLMNALGPVIAGASLSNEKERALTLISGALENLDPDFVDFLCETFAPISFVEVEGGKRPKVSEVFDVFFRAKYGLMIKWLIECVKYNFGDFLADGTLTSSLSQAGTASTSRGPRT